MNIYPKLSLKKGREYQILRGHPWLFSGGISQAPTKVSPGGLVDLVDTNGRFVARGYYNQATDIAVRVLTKDPEQSIDAEFFKMRVQAAWDLRAKRLDFNKTDAFRLVHAEGDFLPGYVVDYYAGVLVVQSHTAGADALMSLFIDALVEVVAPRAIVVRNDSGGRRREGIEVTAPNVVQGELSAEDEIVVRENDVRFAIDVIGGQKTGFFTDQRDKRVALQNYCRGLGTTGGTLINGFCYTGAFSVYATLANPAIRTVNIDESKKALEQAKKNFALNNLSAADHEFLSIDAFTWLEEQRAAEATFDIVILDPPAFAKSHKDKPRALKAYTRMDRLGITITKSGGTLIVCSCSGSVNLEEFLDSLHIAAAETGRDVQILEVFQNGIDHPISVGAPEGNYLKVVFCRVL